MVTRNRDSLLLILALIVGLFGIWGCSKEALFMSDDLADESRFRDTTLYAIRTDWDNALHTKGNPWLSSRLVVANMPGPVEGSTLLARSFLWFTTLPETTAQVENAVLYLYVTRWDCKSGCSSIDLYALTDTLKQLELWWDSMPEVETDPVATFSISQAQDSIVINVSDIVQQWISGEKPNLGLALIADETPGGDFVAEFASREHPRKEEISGTDTTIFDFRPTLRITYIDTADTSGNLESFESIPTVDAFADTLLAAGLLTSTVENIICGNGTPSRAFLMFDIEGIPIEASIAKAVLKLTPDFASSSFDSIDLICHAVVDSPWTHFGSPIGSAGAGRVTVKTSDQTGSTVDFEITVLIQPLVARKVTNRGFVIKSVQEGADLDYVAFFGRGASEDLVPRLEIHYVLPPPPPYGE